MPKWKKVVWSEGLFLRQHHFQRQDSYMDWLFQAGRMLTGYPAYGFAKLDLDEGALDEGRISVRRANGIFPDGTPFEIPSTTQRPDPIVLNAESQVGLVTLSIPEAQSDEKSIDRAEDSRTGTRFISQYDEEAYDITASGGAAERIEVAALAPRLDTPGTEVAQRVSLGIAQVQSVAATGEIRLDQDFIPPVLRLSASPYFEGLLTELINGLDRAVEVHAKVVQGQTSGRYDSLLKLELANSALARLRHFRSQMTQHPSDLYGVLSELAGRLATYEAADRKMRALPEYVHSDAGNAYSMLLDTIRPLLASLTHHTPRHQVLETTRRGENIWAVRLDNPEILKNGSIVLRVMSEMSTEMVIERFSNAIVAGAEVFQSHWGRRLPGVPLKELRSHPRDIPYDGDALCLELDQSSPHWSETTKPPGFAIGITGQLPEEPRINCYVVYR